MEPNDSSRKKRSSKAATPRPSTTSSTTEEVAKPARKPAARKPKSAAKTPPDHEAQEVPPPCLLPTSDEVTTLTRRQQDEYLSLLTKGASPAAACQKLGVSITAILVTMEQLPKFQKRATAVSDLLSQNVAAQLYQTAMKGSVTAQTFFLKNQPPPEWPSEDAEKGAANSQTPQLEISDERLINLVDQARKREKNSVSSS